MVSWVSEPSRVFYSWEPLFFEERGVSCSLRKCSETKWWWTFDLQIYDMVRLIEQWCVDSHEPMLCSLFPGPYYHCISLQYESPLEICRFAMVSSTKMRILDTTCERFRWVFREWFLHCWAKIMMWWPSRFFLSVVSGLWSPPIFSMFWGSRNSGISHHGSEGCELPTFVLVPLLAT